MFGVGSTEYSFFCFGARVMSAHPPSSLRPPIEFRHGHKTFLFSRQSNQLARQRVGRQVQGIDPEEPEAHGQLLGNPAQQVGRLRGETVGVRDVCQACMCHLVVGAFESALDSTSFFGPNKPTSAFVCLCCFIRPPLVSTPTSASTHPPPSPSTHLS